MQYICYDLKPERLSEPIHLWHFTDVHYDSPDCDRELFHKIMRRCSKTPNSIAIDTGDAGDFVLPGDYKRHKNSATRREYAGRDDLLNLLVDEQAEIIKDVPWIARIAGNHEATMLDRRGYDVVTPVCEQLALPKWVKNTTPGHERYAHPVPVISGAAYIRLRFCKKSGKRGAFGAIDLVAIHGGWGGVVVRGLAMAERYWSRMSGPRLLIYGHNHQAAKAVIPKTYWTSGHRRREENCIIQCAPGFLKSNSPHHRTYSCNAPPSPRGARVYRITVISANGQISVEETHGGE